MPYYHNNTPGVRNINLKLYSWCVYIYVGGRACFHIVHVHAGAY